MAIIGAKKAGIPRATRPVVGAIRASKHHAMPVVMDANSAALELTEKLGRGWSRATLWKKVKTGVLQRDRHYLRGTDPARIRHNTRFLVDAIIEDFTTGKIS